MKRRAFFLRETRVFSFTPDCRETAVFFRKTRENLEILSKLALPK